MIGIRAFKATSKTSLSINPNLLVPSQLQSLEYKTVTSSLQASFYVMLE